MFEHITVLKEEAINSLNINPEGKYVDCTLGGAGHSEEIVKKLTTGHLFAFDQDDEALKAAAERLHDYKDKVTFIKSNFRNIKEKLAEIGIDEVDGILYDLGVSSPQFDQAERGFSYQNDGPLDMRMDKHQSLNAATIVNEWDYQDLVRIFFKYGEEKFSKSIARKIEKARELNPIHTTDELVEIIKDGIPAPARRKGGHPAKRIFQALRIAVNDELQAFEDSLKQSIELLDINGRLAVITFHSLEDRICKTILKDFSTPPELPPGLPVIPKDFQPVLKLIKRKPILPSEKEIEDNRRSRSAKLRVAEKIKKDESEG